MADTTAPILLAGGITMLTDYLNDQGVEWRVAVATGIGCGLFALGEKANHDLAVGVAWLALITSVIIPRANGKPGPAETFLAAWNRGSPSTRKA